LATEEYQDLLSAAKFKVLMHKMHDPECGDATIWIAQQDQS
jgi:hypothetical protein